MSSEGLVCWKCGAPLPAMKLPWSRRATCGGCSAELHVCRLCSHYSPRISDQCDEPRAEHPRMKDQANFCDYFKPRPQAYAQRDQAKAQTAKAKLAALFGDAPATQGGDGEARKKLDDLFGAGDKKKS